MEDRKAQARRMGKRLDLFVKSNVIPLAVSEKVSGDDGRHPAGDLLYSLRNPFPYKTQIWEAFMHAYSGIRDTGLMYSLYLYIRRVRSVDRAGL